MREPYARIAHKLLPEWDISLAFVNERVAQALNKRLRNKTYTPNVLSYVVGKKHGEVIICKAIAKKESRDFDLSYPDFLIFLFIHALLHLKGGRHGTTMERREQKLLKEFGSRARNGTTHSNRYRHRHVPSKGRGGRRDSR